ncbi:hypothetical protein Ahy_B10g104050 [Arachis hypogaea]|uniref:DUF4283 domain-containing protein n=1 Tax=Arachis hypogaea TaxID=3818 RepID=A0A444X4M1_ARAHY|nr:hypothetical protein Ahy_B10g104050 [Arachis hypogaea]
MSQNMPNFRLGPIEGKTITIKPNSQKEHKVDSINLVGQIISSKEVPFRSSKNAIMGIWRNPEGVSISEVGRNKVLISFKDMWRGLQTLKGGPWSIKGHLLNLQLWSINIGGRIIGDMMGIVIDVEDPMRNHVLMRTFLRVRVVVDILKPLPTAEEEDEDKSGRKETQALHAEWEKTLTMEIISKLNIKRKRAE